MKDRAVFSPITLLIGVMLLATACASSSGVLQDSPDTYRIATRATWELGGRPGAIKMALKEATDYCAKKKATPKVISSKDDYSHFEGGTVDMRFQCESSPIPAPGS